MALMAHSYKPKLHVAKLQVHVTTELKFLYTLQA